MMHFKFLFKLILLLVILAILITPLLLGYSAIQPLPLVLETADIEQADVGNFKDFLRKHDPRKLADGETGRLMLKQRDLNLMLNLSLPYASRQQTAVILGWGQAEIFHTITLPDNPLGKYFNLSAHLQLEENRLQVTDVGFGDRSLPGWMLNPAIMFASNYLSDRYIEYQKLLDSIQEIRLEQDSVSLTYQWNSDLANRIQTRGLDLLLTQADRKRIVAYYREISNVSRNLNSPTSLTELLRPLFALALQRSEQNGDAVAENRALFLALGMTISGNSIKKFVGDLEDAPRRPARIKLTLQGRDDLARHFSLSAAISSAGGRGLANAVGLYKEMDDSRGGSGFSFADLLADRAGVELSNASLGKRAADIQQRMSGDLQETDYMPWIGELPEGLMELEFKTSYENLDSASYTLINDEIERRITTCSVYR